MEIQVYTPQSGANSGTPLAAANLNTAVTASSCILTGGVPATNGTLTLQQPATTVVVNNGSTAVSVIKTSQSITFTASKDTYVDLSNGGVYTLVAVNNNGGVPGVTANSVRLYKAVSNGSQVTAVTQLGSNFGLDQGSIQVDLTEASTADVLVGTSAGINNMNRVRNTITTLTGLSWASSVANAKKAILQDGTNSVGTGASQLNGVWSIVQGLGISGQPGPFGSSPRFSINADPIGSANYGLVSIGLGGFSGGGTNFAGLAAGTVIAVNTLGSFSGSLIDLARGGVSQFNVTFGGSINCSSVTAAAGPNTLPGGNTLSGFFINTGSVDFEGITTQTSSPSNGGNGALPANVNGYVQIRINGTNRLLPYW